jgi:hypothetical protein
MVMFVMTSVLESSDTLNETWLDDTLACHHADNGAEWRWVMKCCGATIYLCGPHDTKVHTRVDELLNGPNKCVCGDCGRDFGFHPPFHDIFTRLPI